MKGYRKIIIIAIIGLFLGANFTSCIGKTTKTMSNSIEELLEEGEFTTIEIPITPGTKGDPPAGKVWTFGWAPYNMWEIDPFHIVVEYYGKEWETIGGRDL